MLVNNVVASLLAQMVKNLPAMQETRIQSLGQEDSLEKEMATHYNILSHHFMANRWGNSGKSVRLYFWGLQNHCRW